MERVKSSDVLDVTHEVTVSFRASLLGSFRRVGPNAWDDYEFVRKPTPVKSDASGEEELLDVLALVTVQLESRGCDVRVRMGGKVLRVRFQPDAEARRTLSERVGEPFDVRTHARAMREHFVSTHLRAVSEKAGLGASAVIVQKLNR